MAINIQVCLEPPDLQYPLDLPAENCSVNCFLVSLVNLVKYFGQ